METCHPNNVGKLMRSWKYAILIDRVFDDNNKDSVNQHFKCFFRVVGPFDVAGGAVHLLEFGLGVRDEPHAQLYQNDTLTS